ncbi:MAG: arylsulfatase [Pirellulales bacterium]|nr:arylsulfatase [Pirellulales bacterium]
MRFQSSLLLVFLLFFSGNVDCYGDANSPRPNIIIILVDDMGFSDIGCYGGEIETPNLDKLAANGVRFTQFYNSGRCCPTRASLMTGLHPHQVGIGHMTEPPNQPLGIRGPYQGFLNNDCRTLAQVLGSTGYHTIMTGKWHLGHADQNNWPLQRGFQYFYGGISGAFNYFKPGGDRGITEGNTPVDTPDDWYATDAFTEKAIEYIDQATAKDDNPFFLYLAFNSPHWPLNAKWEDYSKYRGKYTAGWQELANQRFKKQKEIGLFDEDVKQAPLQAPDWNKLSESERDRLDAVQAAYAGCIDNIDQNIGRLVTYLESNGQLDNSLIFFLSDNGACQEGGILGQGDEEMVKNPPLETVAGVRQGLAWANASNTPFRLFKHFVHEGGACTPMIAHWPEGIPEKRNGSFNRQHAYLPDFMATCIDLSGAAYPKNLPSLAGNSLVRSLRNPKKATHIEPIFWEHEGNAAMRNGNLKLVREYEKPWELYDLAHDRTELLNLAESESNLLNDMVNQWEEWARPTGVAFPKRFNMYQFLREKKNQR